MTLGPIRISALRFSIALIAPLLMSTNLASADTSLATPLTLPDGTIATPYDICGAGDECGLVKYPNGDELLIYSEGASYGQPYRLRFTVLQNGSVPITEFDAIVGQPGARLGTQRNFLGTYTLDHGKIRFDLYTNKDGTLKQKFTTGIAEVSVPRNQSGP